MYKVAAFIVNKRNLFFLLVILGIVFSAFSVKWIKVENDLVAFLPDNSETKIGMKIMEEQFITLGTAQVMVANITYEHAAELYQEISAVDGVQSVVFDRSSAHYRNASALFTVTFDYEQFDPECEESLSEIKAILDGYDVYIGSDIGFSLPDIIAGEVEVIIVYVAVIIIAVLLLTSQTYAEIPVLLLTFIVAAVLNMGTSFIFGTISFVSNSVTTVLQLALSLDYAVIFCNRYKEEHKTLPIRDAVVHALAKSIPEITASSMTTVGGLFAMVFMQFKIGPDMGINLIKSIFFALFSVFVVMPGLLVWFGPLMDKTVHKNFIPNISFVGKFAHATRFLVPPVFLIVVIGACYFSSGCSYEYGYNKLETSKTNIKIEAEEMIEENFTSMEMVALVVPAGDYEAEGAILEELSGYEEVDSAMGLANVEALGGYMLSDSLSPREFAELADLDYELAQLVYAAYAAEQGSYEKIISSLATYEVPLIDMFLFVCEQMDSGLISLDGAQAEMLAAAQAQMEGAKAQLQGEDYSRMLVYVDIPEGGDTLYAFLDVMRETAAKYYPDGEVYVVGNPTSEYDFQKTFSRDNVVISVLTLLIVLAVLLFTFKSVGMPLLLIMVIQGSIWINFSVPIFTGDAVFFMTYLIVSAIQMGANIDYAIVIASRFNELKDQMPRKQAIVETMNFAFPTIMISGTIMATASFFIGNMTSEGSIANMGMNLGRGTLISIFLVLFVLPQLLLIGDKIIEKTSFSVPKILPKSMVVILVLVLAAGGDFVPVLQVQAAEVASIHEETIKIKDAEDLMELAENCKLDSWSVGKTVVLQADIDLEDVDFEPIPTFGGTFDGKGHSISGLHITGSFSSAGLFGVVQEGAVVKNINVSGTVEPAGEVNAVGGIAGENYGRIVNCSFTGKVSGQQNTGGIAGINGVTGEIQSGRTSGKIQGETKTGGIVGYNRGSVAKCKNDMGVNTKSVSPSISLNDIELNISTDVTKLSSVNMMNAASDSGGIAGYSTGRIEDCSNTAVVGYPHIGYNLGGIAGRSCGAVRGCTNEGQIYGRKDVGGIVGQMEPYIIVKLSESGIFQIKQEMDQLNQALHTAETHMTASEARLKKNVVQIRKYTQKMQELLQGDSITDGELTERLTEVVLQIYMLGGQLESTGQSVIKDSGVLGQDIKNIAEWSGRLSDTVERVVEEAEQAGLADIIVDTSRENIEDTVFGKVADCENRGAVYADIHVGGIAGVVSLEQMLDPEDDLTAEFSMKERRKYEMSAILYECVNRGMIAAKKDYVGGICGRMDLGLIAACEGYGYIYSESGDYVGGIAGLAGSTVQDSFAKCSLAGAKYIGGITGSGITEDVTGESSLVSGCYSMVDIVGYQQLAGAISGVSSGMYQECYFVSDELTGIDRISYEGKAEPITYEELLETEGLPKEFGEFHLTFVADGKVVYDTTFKYGDSFDQDVFPVLPRTEGYYLVWDTAELKDLKKDTVVTAIYQESLTVLASKEERSKHHPIFLAEGEFAEGDELILYEEEKTFVPAEQSFFEKMIPVSVVEKWIVELPSDGLMLHSLRYMLPEDVEEVTVYVKQDGKWKEANTERVGSYLLFHIAGTKAEIAVVQSGEIPWLSLLAAVLIIVVIGGCVRVMLKKQNVVKYLIWGLAVVLLGLLILLGMVLYKGKFRDGVNAYRLLKAYVEQPVQAMDCRLTGKLAEEELDLEAKLYVTELGGKEVTIVEQSGVGLYYADGILYLENGKAYRASEVSRNYAEILDKLVLLYGELDFTSQKDGENTIYTVHINEENTVTLVERNEELLTVTVSSVGTWEDEKYDIHADFAIKNPAEYIAEIPTAVQEQILSENPQVEDFMSEDVFRMYGAWKRLFDRKPLGAQITLQADCGPLNLDQDVTLISTLAEDTRINCVQKGDFRVYFTEDTICSEQGYAVTAKRAESVGVAELLGIAYGLCLKGTFHSTEVDGSYIYSLTLDAEAMEEIASAIAQESKGMGIQFENGTIQVVITDNEVESIRFACDGSLHILITDVAVAFSAELDMTDADRYEGFTVPQKVLDTLVK